MSPHLVRVLEDSFIAVYQQRHDRILSHSFNTARPFLRLSNCRNAIRTSVQPGDQRDGQLRGGSPAPIASATRRLINTVQAKTLNHPLKQSRRDIERIAGVATGWRDKDARRDPTRDRLCCGVGTSAFKSFGRTWVCGRPGFCPTRRIGWYLDPADPADETRCGFVSSQAHCRIKGSNTERPQWPRAVTFGRRSARKSAAARRAEVEQVEPRCSAAKLRSASSSVSTVRRFIAQAPAGRQGHPLAPV